MRHRGTKRSTAAASPDQVIAEMRLAIAAKLDIDPERIRYGRSKSPGQFDEPGTVKWEIFYREEWRELPWHFDGPLAVTRELVRRWYSGLRSK